MEKRLEKIMMIRANLMDLYNEQAILDHFDTQSLLKNLMESKEVNAQVKKVKRGQELISEGESTDYVYYMTSGIASIKKGTNTFGFIGAGQFVGFDTLFLNESSTYTIRTRETCKVYVFDRLEVMEYLFSLQEGWIFFYLVEKEESQRLLKYQHFMRLKGVARLDAMLQDLADTFGTEEDVIVLPKCFSKQCVADYTNFSLNTLASLIKELRREGFLAPAIKDSFFCLSK